jgi:hypothetical protein
VRTRTRIRHVRRAAFVAGTMLFVLSLASSALANVPMRKVSDDPYTNTSSYHKTQLEPDTYSFGSTIVGTFQVGRFTDGGANNLGWATSSDNGQSWHHGFLPGTTVYSNPPGPWARISDPSVAYDPKHDVWIIVGLAIDATVTGKAVTASRSTDGGHTWQNPVTVSQGGVSSFYDKEWIGCDTTPSSPNYGNCYVEWDDAGIGSVFRMSRSTDGGLTWQSSTVPNASVIGGQPLALPNGNVVVPITGNVLESFVSTNGGLSYSGPFPISSIRNHFVSQLRDGGGLASAEVDASGKVYVAWQDCRYRTGCTANDIVIAVSTDGMTWTGPLRVPIAPPASGADFFLPGMGVDHSTGGASAHLGVGYYWYPDASCTVSTCKLNGGFISSTDAGAHWSAPTKLFGPIALRGLPNAGGFFVGDYTSTSFGSNGKAYPVLAVASGSNCTLGQVGSCNEFMAAPTNGLPALGGTRPATTPRVVGHAQARTARNIPITI